jgi:pimeloyl-ACP methyl ester carboxylesterase
MRRAFNVLCLVLLAAVTIRAQSAADARREARDELLRILTPSRPPAAPGRINAQDRTWEDWLRRTGELPPDFAALPSIPDLPDPLLLRETDGRTVPVTTPALWRRQRIALRSQIEQWIFGTMPPAPDNLQATVTDTRHEGGVTVRFVRLDFGPARRASLRIELVIPDGKGPFPVFLTNHARNHPWIYTAVRRGYIAAIYHATDPRYGNGDDSDAWIEIYQDYDWSCLARWAWAASRTVDYLATLAEVDKAKIGLVGHSRNGKQALLAAAMDERIGAVIGSSGNSGENDPWRYTTEPFVNESIELLTGAQSHWFSPRLRFFSGREDKLPVDQNSLMALVAPRGLMLYSGYAESAGNPFGFEQAYRSALQVYRFLGHEQNIWLHLREGEHETTAGDVENFIDFFDAVFGRRAHAKVETWIHGYTFGEWQALSGESIDPSQYPLSRFHANDAPAVRRAKVEWALGQEPPGAPRLTVSKLPTGGTGDGWLSGLFKRPGSDASARARVVREGMGWAEIPFGDDLKADLFYPAGQPAGKWPVIIWMHPYSYQNGWSAASPWESTGADYRLEQRPSIPALVKRGFAVLAFDQIGFGARVRDARDFYRRYPKWSLMGKMVADTRAAIDAVAALDVVDASRISLMGYSLGAKVGLLTAALDSRVHALAAVSGFDPLRLDTADRGVEGIRHYSHLHGLMPRLGFFVGQEARLPFDFDEALALAAPRPVLLIAPTLDRYARIADVRAEVAAVPGVTLETPLDVNRFGRKFQSRVLDWLAEVNHVQPLPVAAR